MGALLDFGRHDESGRNDAVRAKSSDARFPSQAVTGLMSSHTRATTRRRGGFRAGVASALALAAFVVPVDAALADDSQPAPADPGTATAPAPEAATETVATATEEVVTTQPAPVAPPADPQPVQPAVTVDTSAETVDARGRGLPAMPTRGGALPDQDSVEIVVPQPDGEAAGTASAVPGVQAPRLDASPAPTRLRVPLVETRPNSERRRAAPPRREATARRAVSVREIFSMPFPVEKPAAAPAKRVSIDDTTLGIGAPESPGEPAAPEAAAVPAQPAPLAPSRRPEAPTAPYGFGASAGSAGGAAFGMTLLAVLVVCLCLVPPWTGGVVRLLARQPLEPPFISLTARPG